MLYAAFTAHLMTVMQATKPTTTYDLKLRTRLRTDGFLILGQGHFGMAITHPAAPGRVFKLSVRDKDTCPVYLGWCKLNPMRYLPNVYDVRYDGRYAVAVMDQLVETSGALRAAVQHAACLLSEPEEFEEHAPGFSNTIHKLTAAFPWAGSDLHSGNLMVCPQSGDVVITDPFSFSHVERRELNHMAQLLGLQ